MKRVIVTMISIFSCVLLFAQKQFVVDENAEMRTIAKGFSAIKVSGGIDLFLSQGEKESIAVSASDEKLMQNIKTTVENNVLNIYSEGDKSWSKKRRMVVYVSFVNLVKLEASGASDITLAGTVKTTSLNMQLSGASDFKGDVSVTSLDMILSGASDVKISGSATNLNIESSGASDVTGFDLTTDICSAKASGASDINITVNKELNAQASGASNIFYQGTGIIKETHSSGASSISKKGS